MRPFAVSPSVRWASWVVPRTARQSFPQSKRANARPAPITQGARGRHSYPGSQAQRPRISLVRDWILERGRHEGKPYPYHIIPENRVFLGQLVIRLPRHLSFLDDRVDVFIEFSPPGTRHPRCYALRATPEDPACRLALKVRGDTQEGEFTDYVHTYGEALLHKANALTDFLLDTASREEILRRPRRAWGVWGATAKTSRNE